MEEFLKLENLYKEIQLIENAEEKSNHFIYDRAGVNLGNLILLSSLQ